MDKYKYYRITVSTPYCGEWAIHYLRIPVDKNIDDYMALIDDLTAENASEWYDEDLDPDWDDYLMECNAEIIEIPFEEYIAEEDILNNK